MRVCNKNDFGSNCEWRRDGTIGRNKVQFEESKRGHSGIHTYKLKLEKSYAS